MFPGLFRGYVVSCLSLYIVLYDYVQFFAFGTYPSEGGTQGLLWFKGWFKVSIYVGLFLALHTGIDWGYPPIGCTQILIDLIPQAVSTTPIKRLLDIIYMRIYIYTYISTWSNPTFAVVTNSSHVIRSPTAFRSQTWNKMLCYCIQCRAAQRGRTRPLEFWVVGFHPFEKYARQNGNLPQGVKNKKYLKLKPPPSFGIVAPLGSCLKISSIDQHCTIWHEIAIHVPKWRDWTSEKDDTVPSFEVSVQITLPSWTHPLQCVCSCPPSYWRKAWTPPQATHMWWTKHGQSPVKLERSRLQYLTKGHMSQNHQKNAMSQNHLYRKPEVNG